MDINNVETLDAFYELTRIEDFNPVLEFSHVLAYEINSTFYLKEINNCGEFIRTER